MVLKTVQTCSTGRRTNVGCSAKQGRMPGSHGSGLVLGLSVSPRQMSSVEDPATGTSPRREQADDVVDMITRPSVGASRHSPQVGREQGPRVGSALAAQYLASTEHLLLPA
jgi:hypothetical protein